MAIHEIKRYVDDEQRTITCLCDPETGKIRTAKGMFHIPTNEAGAVPIVFTFEEERDTIEEYFEMFDGIKQEFMDKTAAANKQAPIQTPPKGGLYVPQHMKGDLILPH